MNPRDYIYYGWGRCTVHGKYGTLAFTGCPECMRDINKTSDGKIKTERIYMQEIDSLTQRVKPTNRVRIIY